MTLEKRILQLEDSAPGDAEIDAIDAMPPEKRQRRIGELLDLACARHNANPVHAHPHVGPYAASYDEAQAARIAELMEHGGWRVWHDENGLMRWTHGQP